MPRSTPAVNEKQVERLNKWIERELTSRNKLIIFNNHDSWMTIDNEPQRHEFDKTLQPRIVNSSEQPRLKLIN